MPAPREEMTGQIIDPETVEGEPLARQRVDQWIRKYLNGHEVDGDFDVRVYQKATGEKHGLPIGEPVPHDPVDGNVEDLLDSVLQIAVDDVEQQKKRVRYAVRIDGREGECSFTLKATRGGVRDEDVDDDLADLDDDNDFAASPKGQIALANDQAFRFGRLFERVALSNRKLDREIIKELREENERLRRQHSESLRLLERAHNQVHLRDLDIKRFEKSEARKDQIAGMAMQVGLPALISHLSEGKVPMGALMRSMQPPPAPAPAPPQAPSADGAAGAPAPSSGVEAVRAPFDRRTGEQVDALIRTIDPEQLPKIQGSGVFAEAQLELLMAMFNTRLECDAAVRAARGES